MLRSAVQGLSRLCLQNTAMSIPGPTLAGGILRLGNMEDTFKPSPLVQQVRTTFILKRRKRVELEKAYKKQNRELKSRHFIYDLVEDINVKKKDPVKVILTNSVDGLGSRGEIVEVKPNRARNHLLLQGCAVYASPENLEKYATLLKEMSAEDQPSSQFARKTAEELSWHMITVSMNLQNSWTLEPWHIRVAFRKAGIIVPEEAITLPPHVISGPDLSLENKEFYVTIKINGKEETRVRCRLHHFATKVIDRLPWVRYHWQYPAEPLFTEDAPLLQELTRKNKFICYPEEEAL